MTFKSFKGERKLRAPGVIQQRTFTRVVAEYVAARVPRRRRWLVALLPERCRPWKASD
jgi:hypothetical protein